MSIKAFPTKDPEASQRFYFDWTPWVTVEEGGDIVDFAVTVDDGDGALVLGDKAKGDGAYASFLMQWISGGTEGVEYTVTCRATLTDGTVEDRSRTLLVTSH